YRTTDKSAAQFSQTTGCQPCGFGGCTLPLPVQPMNNLYAAETPHTGGVWANGWLLVAKQVETTADAWNLRIPNYLCQQQDKLGGVRRRFPTHRASSTKQSGSSKRRRLSWMSFSLCR